MKKTTDHEHHDRRFVTTTQPGQQGNRCVIMQGCTHSFYPFRFNMLAHMNIFCGMQFCGTAGGEDALIYKGLFKKQKFIQGHEL